MLSQKLRMESHLSLGLQFFGGLTINKHNISEVMRTLKKNKGVVSAGARGEDMMNNGHREHH